MSKKGLSDNTKGVIISCGVALLSVLLSEFLPNRIVRLIFVVILIVGIVLYFKGQDENEEKKENTRIYRYASYVLSVCLALMLVVFGLVPDLSQKLAEWHDPESSEITKKEESPSAKDMLLERQPDLTQTLSGLQTRVDETVSGVTNLVGSLKSDSLLSEKTDPAEVQSVLDKLMEDEEIILENFPNIKSSRDEVMLCYKMFLYEMLCHYSSILRAFEEYGIDCNALNIDQSDLIRWDVERMYAIYSMKQELEPDLAENTFYSSKTFNFTDHRMSMNEYSDTFDYGEWNFTLENIRAQEYEKILDGQIMAYYQKFHLNFSMN